MKKLLLLVGIIMVWSYNATAQSCDDTLPVMEDFTDPNVINVCWNLIDKDGDGNNWAWKSYNEAYGGYKVISSNSWTSSGVLTPDNWIISHQIDLTSFSTSEEINLSWKVRGEYAAFSHEYYTIYAATGNGTSDFESSPVQRGEYADLVGGDGNFVTRSLDISELAGNIVYIAFRHHDSTNQYNINIDDVSVSTSTLGIEDMEIHSFMHYYNTNSDVLTLKSSQTAFNSVIIYNTLGQNVLNRLLSQTTETLNLSALKDGIYIAKINIDNNTKTIKFLKQ